MSSSNADPSQETQPASVAIDEAVAPPENTDTPEPVELPLDQVFRLLTNQRRRRVLKVLKGREDPIRIGNLAEQIAAIENDKPVTQLDSDERKCVYVGLYQLHLPKMDELDVIEYNKPRGIIERGRNAHVLDSYLERAESGRETLSWPWYYVNLSVVGAVALGLSLWLQPQTTLPVVTIAVIGIVAAFCACSIIHYRSK